MGLPLLICRTLKRFSSCQKRNFLEASSIPPDPERFMYSLYQGLCMKLRSVSLVPNWARSGWRPRSMLSALPVHASTEVILIVPLELAYLALTTED